MVKKIKEIINLEKDARVYLASPLGAPTKAEIQNNIFFAEKKLATYANCFSELRFVAPHTWFPRFLDDNIPAERAFAMECGQRILDFCDALLLCGDRLSSGMEAELRSALRAGKTVFAEAPLYDHAAAIQNEEKKNQHN